MQWLPCCSRTLTDDYPWLAALIEVGFFRALIHGVISHAAPSMQYLGSEILSKNRLLEIFASARCSTHRSLRMCRTMTGGTRRWRHLHSSDSSRLLDHYLSQQLLKRPILSHHCWLDWKHTGGTAPTYTYSGPCRNQREHKKRPWEDVVCFERMFDVKKR